MLTREHSASDRRKVIVRLAPGVHEDIGNIEEEILKTFDDLVRKIGPETAQIWCDVLTQVNQVLAEDKL
jgi:DNA-binding MarR family transcriptional regulator